MGKAEARVETLLMAVVLVPFLAPVVVRRATTETLLVSTQRHHSVWYRYRAHSGRELSKIFSLAGDAF